MPTGTKLTNAQRTNIIKLKQSGMSLINIAKNLDLGESTVARIVRIDWLKNGGAKVTPEIRTVAALAADHAEIKEYARVHRVKMPQALHMLMHDQDLISNIQREAAIILDAAKTHIPISIKKKWWHI